MSEDLIPVEDPAAARQDLRLAEVPELLRKTHERLAVELALKVEDAEEIFRRYNYSPDDAAALLESPAFLLLLQQTTKEMLETGVSFRTKAKVLANELLPYAHEIATDPMQSASVRSELIQWSAKMADYEPKKAEVEKAGGGGLTLSITFAGQAPQQVVAGRESLTIDQEAV